MKIVVRTVCVAVAVLIAAAAHSGEKKGKPLSSKSLVGSYVIIGGERAGKPLPKEDVGNLVVFTKNTIVVHDKDKKETYSAKYHLHADDDPVTIHMTSVKPEKGKRVNGIIKRDGDVVTLVYAQPGGKAPTEFKTQDKQLLIRLKKQAK